MRPTLIGSRRLYAAVQQTMRIAHVRDGEGQRTETLMKNSPVMPEPQEVADCGHRASFERTREYIISYDALWESMMRCIMGVRWKPSVKQFFLNAPLEILRMHGLLTQGTWKNGRPHAIQILYPKRREGLAIRFPDRVYQRSINDNALYPEMTRHFIAENCACQKGKGPDYARALLRKHLWNHYANHGTDGWVLQIDITGYYPNMRHDKVKECFGRYLDPEVHGMVCDVLDQQYSGDVGYNPGSQMVQIAGISLLNPLDHFIKERLGFRHFIRYMDDFWILADTREELESALEKIEERLLEYGLTVSAKKTHITKLSEGFRFLGFDYRITESGKVIMTINPESVKHERKKLFRLASLVNKGKLPKSKAIECYESWRAHADHGNSWRLLNRMDGYFESLFKEAV
ncbi:MAG TPA: hypothetical protein DCP98_04465 [Sphaerochaeta sp.]|nr:hypothetical protein [Sphaerochaeta sp.]